MRRNEKKEKKNNEKGKNCIYGYDPTMLCLMVKGYDCNYTLAINTSTWSIEASMCVVCT